MIIPMLQMKETEAPIVSKHHKGLGRYLSHPKPALLGWGWGWGASEDSRLPQLSLWKYLSALM